MTFDKVRQVSKGIEELGKHHNRPDGILILSQESQQVG